MIIVPSLHQIPALQKPIALAIGNFDGVHQGHQYLLTELKKHGTPVVLTFSNHPMTILKPQEAVDLILTFDEKLELFERFGIAMTLALPFTQELAQTPYDRFLRDLHTALPFSTLVGGEDIRLGSSGQGDASAIRLLSHKLGFKTIFLPKLKLNEEIISSRQIRTFIKNQQLDQATKWLGHSKGLSCLDSHVES